MSAAPDSLYPDPGCRADAAVREHGLLFGRVRAVRDEKIMSMLRKCRPDWDFKHEPSR